jgi:hypothetical protein
MKGVSEHDHFPLGRDKMGLPMKAWGDVSGPLRAQSDTIVLTT